MDKHKTIPPLSKTTVSGSVFIPFNESIERFKNGDVLVNDNNNVELLKLILDTVFNRENNVGGYSNYYYREETGYWDNWINSRSYPNNRKTFLLSDVEFPVKNNETKFLFGLFKRKVL